MEDSTMLDASQGIFDEMNVVIIPNALSKEHQQKLATDITAAGGKLLPFDASHGRIEELEDVTHIVSTTSDFPDYQNALDRFIHVVKPIWVDVCLQNSKIRNPRMYSPDPALFMNEVVICCGDIPEGDQEAIEGGVSGAGGQFTAVMTKQVTHLIALSMADERAQLVVAKRLRCQIVLPHWFDDCLKVGRRISERPYTFPNPEILNVEAGAILPIRASPSIKDASDPEPLNDPLPPIALDSLEPPRSIKAFKGKKVMLGSDLRLNDRLKRVITQLIQAGGGDVTNNVDIAQIYVCNYREGHDYVKASQAKKDVGNLSWLYYLITHDTWTNPMRRMLHYPRPRGGIPGFKDYKISISSYTGEARLYLENLVKASGAQFTKTFKQENTHLITAHKQSEKCEAAQEWGVHITNHLWLEESYAMCEEQTLTCQKYTWFPSRTNMGEVLGQTELDAISVERTFFPKTKKPKVVKQMPPQNVVPGSSAPNTRNSNDLVARNSPLAEKTRRTKTTGDIATPSTTRYVDGKENETPGTTGSRGAKDRALVKLHDAAPDIAKFEKEMKRKGGVIHGGRRDKDAEVAEKAKNTRGRDSTASKRSIDEVDSEEEDTTEDEELEEPAKKNKRARKEKLTPIQYRMMLSGDKRWADGNLDKHSKEKARLREIGLHIVEDPKNIDLLCAPQMVRTIKFVSALACAPVVVSTSFLDYAIKYNKLPPPEDHILEDQKFEELRGFSLAEALERAQQNKKRLLRDWTIYCTNQAPGGFDTFQSIVEANGGRCNKWTGKSSNATASKRTVDTSIPNKDVSQNQQEDEGDVLYLISEPSKREFPLWVKFRELAKKHDMIPRIVTTEWILFVAMAQYVHFDPAWELSEEVVNAK